MTDYTQEQLVSIANDFSKAALRKQDDPSFEDKVIDASSQDEAIEFISLSAAMADMKEQFGDKVYSNPEYAEVSIALADKLADIYSRFCSKAEAASLVPKSAAQEGVAEAFEKQGAKALAKFFKP